MKKTLKHLRNLTNVLFFVSIVAAVVCAMSFDWLLALAGLAFALVFWYLYNELDKILDQLV